VYKRQAQAFGTLSPAQQDTLAHLCRELGLAQAQLGDQRSNDPTAPDDPARPTDAAGLHEETP